MTHFLNIDTNMYKRVYGRKFKKDINQRKALFRGLMRSLALHESIKTTEAKAKAIKGEFESHITKAKEGEDARYNLGKHLPKDAVDRLIKDIAPRMKDRNGGYTRIIRMGNRVKDNAEIVMLELVEKGELVVEQKVKKSNSKMSKKSVATKASTKTQKTTQPTEDATKKVEKKTAFKPLANIKQMVTRQKKGSS